MSEDDALPLVVRELIRERIHSIESLEVVLALRAQRGSALDFVSLANQLRIAESSVESAVEELAAVNLATRVDARHVRYSPESDSLDEAMSALFDAYQSHRVETLVLISSLALGRVRSSALHTFAEAFRLRGPKK